MMDGAGFTAGLALTSSETPLVGVCTIYGARILTRYTLAKEQLVKMHGDDDSYQLTAGQYLGAATASGALLLTRRRDCRDD